ncbi:CLC_0170 family protein [Caloramator sp. mosi_1]
MFYISIFLYRDSKEYKQKGLQKEYKFCRFLSICIP